MRPPNIINDYFFDYINYEKNRTKTIYTNSKNNYGNYFSRVNQRKSSVSSEGFEKIGFENLNETEEYIKHPKSKSHRITLNNRDICEEIFEYKMKMYSNLLIERRNHYCPSNPEISLEEGELENHNESYYNCEKESKKSDMIEVYVEDNRYDIVDSYVRLKCMNNLDENLRVKGI
jgi:hypothetical protein